MVAAPDVVVEAAGPGVFFFRSPGGADALLTPLAGSIPGGGREGFIIPGGAFEGDPLATAGLARGLPRADATGGGRAFEFALVGFPVAETGPRAFANAAFGIGGGPPVLDELLLEAGGALGDRVTAAGLAGPPRAAFGAGGGPRDLASAAPDEMPGGAVLAFTGCPLD